MESMSNDTFDLKRVKQLVELMKVNDLTDLEIKQGEWEITLRRGSQRGAIPNMSALDMSALLPTPSVPAAALPAVATTTPVKPEEPENTTVI
jgi:biotin carboxyl carrier protein